MTLSELLNRSGTQAPYQKVRQVKDGCFEGPGEDEGRVFIRDRRGTRHEPPPPPSSRLQATSATTPPAQLSLPAPTHCEHTCIHTYTHALTSTQALCDTPAHAPGHTHLYRFHSPPEFISDLSQPSFLWVRGQPGPLKGPSWSSEGPAGGARSPGAGSWESNHFLPRKWFPQSLSQRESLGVSQLRGP